jgi:hypothetical protein
MRVFLKTDSYDTVITYGNHFRRYLPPPPQKYLKEKTFWTLWELKIYRRGDENTYHGHGAFDVNVI